MSLLLIKENKYYTENISIINSLLKTTSLISTCDLYLENKLKFSLQLSKLCICTILQFYFLNTRASINHFHAGDFF